jgi:hypothetical protein
MFVQTAKNAARILKMAKAASKAKSANKAATAAKALKTAKTAKTVKTAKPVKAAVKGYGENKAYARLKDMKKSEFYRDRHNAGKTYSEPDSQKTKNMKAAASVGASAAGVAYILSQKNKKK